MKWLSDHMALVFSMRLLLTVLFMFTLQGDSREWATYSGLLMISALFFLIWLGTRRGK